MIVLAPAFLIDLLGSDPRNRFRPVPWMVSSSDWYNWTMKHCGKAWRFLPDSIDAPLFPFAFAGLPGELISRFVNTCDAMVGSCLNDWSQYREPDECRL
jgi:cobalamin biosynthesis protein CobD/CbiB